MTNLRQIRSIEIPIQDATKLQEKLSSLEARLIIERERNQELGDDNTAALIRNYITSELISIAELKKKLHEALILKGGMR